MLVACVLLFLGFWVVGSISLQFMFCFEKAQWEHQAAFKRPSGGARQCGISSHSRVYRVSDAYMNDGLVWQTEQGEMSC